MKGNYLFLFCVLIFLAFSLLPVSAHSIYVPDFRVNRDSSIRIAQYYEDIAFDSSGNFIIVYTDRGVNHDHRKVYFQRFDSLANFVGEPVLVTDTSIHYNDEPHIAMHPCGNFIIVWTSGKPDPVWNYDWDIYLRRYDNAGNPLGQAQQVDVDWPDTGWIADFSPEIAMYKDGSFVVVWEGQKPHKGGIAYGQLFNSSGDRVGTSFLISDPNACDYPIFVTGEFPRVAYNSQGYFFVGWKGTYTGLPFGPEWPMGRVYNPAGQPITKVTLLFLPGSQWGVGNDVAVVANSQNNFVTAICVNDTLGTYPNNAVAVRTFDTLGNPLSDVRIVNDVIDLGDVFWTQRIAITDSDGYVVLWSDSRYKRDLWAQRFNAANEPQGSNYRINSVPGSLATPSGAGWNQLDYALAIHKNTVVFAWDDFRNYNTYNVDIYAKLLNLDKIGYYYRGDVNLDGTVTVGDIIYLINYLFKNGCKVLPEWTGDANSDGKITVSDVVYLVNYLFKGGPPPQK